MVAGTTGGIVAKMTDMAGRGGAAATFGFPRALRTWFPAALVVTSAGAFGAPWWHSSRDARRRPDGRVVR